MNGALTKVGLRFAATVTNRQRRISSSPDPCLFLAVDCTVLLARVLRGTRSYVPLRILFDDRRAPNFGTIERRDGRSGWMAVISSLSEPGQHVGSTHRLRVKVINRRLGFGGRGGLELFSMGLLHTSVWI
jgi:hypothetical protein